MDKKLEYLKMIQGAIERMSTSSAVFKGFTATIVAGVLSLSFAGIDRWVLLLNIIPIICFAFMDIYYLRIERKYRLLYNLVRTDNHAIDYDMALPGKGEIKKYDEENPEHLSKTSVLYCAISPSIVLFYLPLVLIVGTICVLKATGCLG